MINFYIITVIVILLISLTFIVSNKKRILNIISYKENNSSNFFNLLPDKLEYSMSHNRKYTGLVIFDIDGTLTTGIENDKMVEHFLNIGYAVGISTAGSLYNIYNLHTFRWMPRNLLKFMRQTNYITFNNIGSKILSGRFDPMSYARIEHISPKSLSYMERIGYKKGFSIVETAKVLDIEKIIMFDDMSSFLRGIKIYDPRIMTFCAGDECGTGPMSLDSVKEWE